MGTNSTKSLRAAAAVAAAVLLVLAGLGIYTASRNGMARIPRRTVISRSIPA